MNIIFCFRNIHEKLKRGWKLNYINHYNKGNLNPVINQIPGISYNTKTSQNY